MSVTAIWQGPFTAQVGARVLIPGDEYEVTEQDLESTHWRKVAAPKRSKPSEGDS